MRCPVGHDEYPDETSYCVRDGCRSLATHGLLVAMQDDVPVVELVCCRHAGLTVRPH